MISEPYPRFDLEHQVALVTGAARGLGHATALALARAGADIALGLRDAKIFDLTCAVNLKGTFFVSQAVGRVMIRQQAGRIINLSSQAGFVALPGESIYCMTKAGISHLTKCLAVEWGKYGITVNAVAPTFIVTPGTAQALENEAFKADVIERIAALHRVGQPIDVTGAIVFLASPAASLITGHTILIDGGWTAR
jgi:NAD(P)-dependent dehydrogenase (short-subunit alcohol dehydrogenase family)